MKDVQRLFTPPEWDDWHWLARIAYVVVFAGIMIPVVLVVKWAGGLVSVLLSG